jgi:hypothetical protein
MGDQKAISVIFVVGILIGKNSYFRNKNFCIQFLNFKNIIASNHEMRQNDHESLTVKEQPAHLT